MKKQTVINYHITEKCNFLCKHCFAEYGLKSHFKNELHHDISKVRQLLVNVFQHFSTMFPKNSLRLNIAGGEPMIVKNIPSIIACAADIGFEVSVITNGSVISKTFIDEYIKYISVFGISIDSFDDISNQKIGRVTKHQRGVSFDKVLNVIKNIRRNKSNIIKINTVVSSLNYQQDMSSKINQLKPEKWKVLEALPNIANGKHIRSGEFIHFLNQHKNSVEVPIFAESNDDLLDSYYMLDPMGRFYQRQTTTNFNLFSEPVLSVGTAQALKQISFNEQKYPKRYQEFLSDKESEQTISIVALP